MSIGGLGNLAANHEHDPKEMQALEGSADLELDIQGAESVLEVRTIGSSKVDDGRYIQEAFERGLPEVHHVRIFRCEECMLTILHE